MSRLRIATALGILLVGLAAAAVTPQAPRLWPESFLLWGLLLSGPFFIVFGSEPEELPEECCDRRPRIWLAPLYAGGGRGLLLLGLCLVWLLAGMLAGRAWAHPGKPLLADEDPTQWAIVAMYAWIYVALPSTLFARRERDPGATWALRAGIVGLAFGSWLLGIYGLATDLLVPAAMVEMVKPDGGMTQDSVVEARVLLTVFSLSVILALPRMVRGVLELRAPGSG